MRPFPAIACALLLTTSCTHALSQPKTQVMAGDASQVAVDRYASMLRPQLPLSKWQPRLSAPKLRCPQGARQVMADEGSSWNTYCVRGEVRHGPSRSFDSTARREKRMEYRDGKLHGWFIELVMEPTMTVQGSSHSGYTTIPRAEQVAASAATLKRWLPLASPPTLSCPPFTRQHNDKLGTGWVAECRLADGTAHGPRRAALSVPGTERWSFFDNGVKQKQELLVGDGRTSREMLYENGEMKRRLQFAGSKIQIFEVLDGERRAMIRWHTKGGVAQLSRFVAGKRDGQWLRWHESGKPAARTLYRDGVEQPGAQTFDKEGRTVQIRQLTAGNGTIEHRDSSKRVTLCTYKNHKKHGSCRSTNAKGALTRVIHYDKGKPTGGKTWFDSGALRTDWINRPETGYSKQTNYDAAGRVTQVSECHGSQCSVVKYDRHGKATTTPESQPASALRYIEDML